MEQVLVIRNCKNNLFLSSKTSGWCSNPDMCYQFPTDVDGLGACRMMIDSLEDGFYEIVTIFVVKKIISKKK